MSVVDMDYERFRRYTGSVHEEGCDGTRCVAKKCGLVSRHLTVSASSVEELDALLLEREARQEAAAPALNAALAARQEYRYPTGWPAKLRPALDEVRAMLADGAPLKRGAWHWWRKGTEGRGAEPGTFLVVLDEGGEAYRGHHDGLAAWLDEVRPGWRETPAVKAPRPRAPKVVEVVVTDPEPVAEVDSSVAVDAVAYPSRVDAQRARRDDDRLAAYLDRLVYGPKQEYAAAYVAHVVDGAPAPTDPGTDWADKVRRKVARLAA